MTKTNKRKILVIGSSNTDMTVKCGKLPAPGETVLGGEFIMGAGGKGANQAVAAKRLGGDVDFICKVGKDMFGEKSVAKYSEEGISTEHVLYSDHPSGVALITVDDNAENCIVVASGANGDMTTDDIERLAPVIRGSDILLLQLEIPVESVALAAKIGSEAGVKVILNPAPACRLPEDIYKNLYLIIPNQGETTILTGIEVKDDKTAILGAKSFWEKGVKRTIITMGSKGSMLYDDGKDMFIPAKKVKAIDTTAAGDTFCGAVCVALAEGKTLKEAAEFATAASSITVQRMGAQDSIPTRKEVPAKTEIRPRATTLSRGEMADVL